MTQNGQAVEMERASWFAELLLRAIPESSSLEEALEATEVALTVQPLPPSVTLSHDIFNPRAQEVLSKALAETKKFSQAAFDDLEKALALPTLNEVGRALVAFINTYRFRLAELLGQTALAALLEGAMEVASSITPVPLSGLGVPLPPSFDPKEAAEIVERLRPLPPVERAQAVYELPAEQQEFVHSALVVPPGPAPFVPLHPEEATFSPVIDEAVRILQEKNLLKKEDYDELDEASKQKAFTVAGVESREMLEKIRDALIEGVEGKQDLRSFQQKVRKEIGEEALLSDAHLETVYRTTIQSAFSEGQMRVLRHPYVWPGFPYAAYDAIHDSRVREDHLNLETLGIQNTNIYRIDDPVFQKFLPPWAWNCRCSWVPLTIRQASEKGISEAIQWLKTGIEPTSPAFVAMPPFEPPPEFRRSIEALPLSLQLSLRPIQDWGESPLADLFEEAIASIELGMVGNEWHGPKPPGEGWTEIAPGPRGGKRWTRGAGHSVAERKEARLKAREEKLTAKQKAREEKVAAAAKAKEEKLAARRKAKEEKVAAVAQARAEKAAAKIREIREKTERGFAAAREIFADPTKATMARVHEVGEAILVLRLDDLKRLKQELGLKGGATKAAIVDKIKQGALQKAQLEEEKQRKEAREAQVAAQEAARAATPKPTEEQVRQAEEDYRQHGTRSRAFKEWFGDWETDPANSSKVVKEDGSPSEQTPVSSKVVDESGKPIAVYHGTPWNEFQEFDPSFLGGPEAELYGQGFYFTDTRAVVETYESKGSGIVKGPKATLKLPPVEAAKVLRNLLAAEVPRLTAELQAAEDELQRTYDIFQRENTISLIPGITSPEAEKALKDWRDAQDKRNNLSTELNMATKYRSKFFTAARLRSGDIPFHETLKEVLGDKLDQVADVPKGHVFEAYLNIRNPFDTKTGSLPLSSLPESVKTKVEKKLAGFLGSAQMPQEVGWSELKIALGSKQATNDFLISLGYDGLTHEGQFGARAGQRVSGVDTHRVWIIFPHRPEAIKAKENRGTFSPAEKNIKLAIEAGAEPLDYLTALLELAEESPRDEVGYLTEGSYDACKAIVEEMIELPPLLEEFGDLYADLSLLEDGVGFAWTPTGTSSRGGRSGWYNQETGEMRYQEIPPGTRAPARQVGPGEGRTAARPEPAGQQPKQKAAPAPKAAGQSPAAPGSQRTAPSPLQGQAAVRFQQLQQEAQRDAADPNNAVNRLKSQMAEVKFGSGPAIRTIRSTQDSPLSAKDHEQVASFHSRIGGMMQALGNKELAQANFEAAKMHRNAVSHKSTDKYNVISAISKSLKESPIDEQIKQEYEKSINSVLGRLSEKSFSLMNKALKKVSFFSSTDDIAKIVGVNTNIKGKKLKVFAAFGGGGHALLDGAGGYWRTEEIYAHELSHAIAKGAALDQTPEWEEIFRSEIDTESAPLSRYARENQSEGFAEFGRLLYGSRVSDEVIEKAFPRASAYWKSQGLWREGL